MTTIRPEPTPPRNWQEASDLYWASRLETAQAWDDSEQNYWDVLYQNKLQIQDLALRWLNDFSLYGGLRDHSVSESSVAQPMRSGDPPLVLRQRWDLV